MKKILVIGSSNIDFVLEVDNMPKTGETLRSKNFSKIPGGKGANQACACGRLSGDTTFLSAVGDDGLGSIVLDELQNANVDTSRVLKVKNTPSGMAIITVNSSGDNSIVIVAGANEHCDYDYFMKSEELLKSSDIFVLQLETPIEDIYKIAEYAKKEGKTVILDPAPAPDSLPDNLLNGLDYITPNETELQKLTSLPVSSVDEIEKAAKVLYQKGVKNILVTMGARGAMLYNESGCSIHETPDTKRVDSTAAGDTFNAGFAVGLSEGMSVEGAIELANKAAAISITKKGAQTSIPTRDELIDFYK